MKAVVLGSWGIGEAVLRAALETEGVDVVAVFTRVRDEGSDDPFRNLVANLADQSGVRTFPPKAAAGTEGEDLLRSLAPDVILSAAHPSLLSPGFLKIPRYGLLNLHGSLLPKNRGTSPVNWALIRDEAETGLTMHYIDEGMDTGDVIYQEVVPIADSDFPGTLADRIKAHAAPMIQRALKQLLGGHSLPRTVQDHSRATLAPRLKPADLVIDWDQDARVVWSFIRGTSQPGLGARTNVDGRETIIWRAIIGQLSAGEKPGTVVSSDSEWLTFACKDRLLQVSRTALEPVGS